MTIDQSSRNQLPFDLSSLELERGDFAMMDDLRSAMLRQFTDLPRHGTPAAELTDRDKVALAIAFGCPVETVMDGTMMTMRTLKPIGVADRGDGGWIVAIGPDLKSWGHISPQIAENRAR